jgi:hypothetical protein
MPLLIISLFQLLCSFGSDRIEVIIPSVEAETEYVWRTIRDIPFFEQHNYQVSLPKGELIENLKEKSRSNELSDSDYQLLEAFMKNGVYNKTDYEKGSKAIMQSRVLVNKMIKEFEALEKDWEYKVFEKYKIKLTLYGPGGSYDPDTGEILIYTTKEGGFKQYRDPSNTLIHEIIHIGTEASIMSKYNVSHPLKERIIDNLVMINFKQYLPDYKIQSFGDARIDAFLTKEEDIKQLSAIIEHFQLKH